MRNHLIPHFGEVITHAINLDTCEKYKRKRLEAGAKKSTINRELSTLKAILKYAVQTGLALEGLGRHARMFTNVESKETRVLKLEEPLTFTVNLVVGPSSSNSRKGNGKA